MCYQSSFIETLFLPDANVNGFIGLYFQWPDSYFVFQFSLKFQPNVCPFSIQRIRNDLKFSNTTLN